MEAVCKGGRSRDGVIAFIDFFMDLYTYLLAAIPGSAVLRTGKLGVNLKMNMWFFVVAGADDGDGIHGCLLSSPFFWACVSV